MAFSWPSGCPVDRGWGQPPLPAEPGGDRNVVIAALPAAQNLFTHTSRYGVAERFARDSILLSTLLSVPALIAVAALLG